jgi:hypothetical protein
MSEQQGWIGVDLDGTLAMYDNFNGVTAIGDPIPIMVARVKYWLRMGRDVRIFTARVGPGWRTPEEVAATVRAIEDWCEEHLGQVIPVTATKDYGMAVLYDDRAVGVERNTGRLLS